MYINFNFLETKSVKQLINLSNMSDRKLDIHEAIKKRDKEFILLFCIKVFHLILSNLLSKIYLLTGYYY